MKFRLKPALVPICIVFFLMNMAINFTYPYLALQMLTLGLNMQDVTLVMGLAPFIGFFGSPLLGYVGDKFGYKIVLIFSILMTMILQTSFNFLPVYRKFHNKIALNASFESPNLSGYINQNDVIWVASYVEDKINCENEYLRNMTIRSIVCDETTYDVNINFNMDNVVNITSKDCAKVGKNSCKFVFKNDIPADEVIYCDIVFNGQEEMEPEDGSHDITLWLYFVLRVIFGVVVNAMFNISDASASKLAMKERSSYSIMLWFASIGAFLPQFIVGPIVDNINLGSSYTDCLSGIETTPKDYKIPFLICDGILFITAIFTFFCLEISVEEKIVKEKISLRQEFKWLSNPAALTFYFVTLVMGLVIGASETFFFIYCQEVLGATTTFLGYIYATCIATSICSLPFTSIFIKKVGIINSICLGLFMMSARIFAWAFPFSTPPYSFLAYGIVDGFFTLYIVAVVAYVGKIAPPELTATGISIQSVLTFIVGKGVGALIGGKLVDAFSMKTMFISVGVFGFCISLLYWIIYHLFLKKFELDHTKDSVEKAAEPIKSGNGLDDKNYVYTGIFYSTHL